MQLSDSTIVVTGASSGLGKAMAGAFVREGADVVWSSRSRERLETAIEQETGSDPAGTAAAIPADVRSWDAVQSLIERTTERFGPIDVFVNNAGVMQYIVNEDNERKPIPDVPIESWDTILETNLRGAFLCAKAVLPGMLDRESGRVINVSSSHGSHGRANRSPYVASKFGLEGLHESMALELEDTGVDSVALRPPRGGVYTEVSVERGGRSMDSFTHDSPDVIAGAAVRLAAGEGDNGGRYQATGDGDGYTEYTRTGD